MSHFTVDVLTPSKVVAKDIPAASLLIPTVNGQINVLEGHTHIVSKLETGILSIFGDANDVDQFFAISTGVCKVIGNKVTVLAQTTENANELDMGRAQATLSNAEEMLKRNDLEEDDRVKYLRKVERANIRIQLANEVSKR
jgi:F-type H+-transporting ATPase subunit epsilon